VACREEKRAEAGAPFLSETPNACECVDRAGVGLLGEKEWSGGEVFFPSLPLCVCLTPFVTSCLAASGFCFVFFLLCFSLLLFVFVSTACSFLFFLVRPSELQVQTEGFRNPCPPPSGWIQLKGGVLFRNCCLSLTDLPAAIL